MIWLPASSLPASTGSTLKKSNQHNIDEHNDVEVNPSQKVPLICENL